MTFTRCGKVFSVIVFITAEVTAAAGCVWAAAAAGRGILFAGILAGIGLVPVIAAYSLPGPRFSRKCRKSLLAAAVFQLLAACGIAFIVQSRQETVVRAFICTCGSAAQAYILPEYREAYASAVEEREKLLGEKSREYPSNVFQGTRIDKVETQGDHAAAVTDDGFVFQLQKVGSKWYIVSIPGLGELDAPQSGANRK